MLNWRAFRGRMVLVRLVAGVLLCGVSGLVESRAGAQCVGGWQPGDGLPGVDGEVRAMTWWDPDGPGPLPRVLVVGGQFWIAGGRPAAYLAVWDGVSWSRFANGPSAPVNALLGLPDGRLVVAGEFTDIGSDSQLRSIAIWNPVSSSWGPAGGGAIGAVSALALRTNGHAVAVLSSGGVAEWNGSWQYVGWEFGTVSAAKAVAAAADGSLIVGGTAANGGSRNVVRVAASGPVALGNGVPGTVSCVAVAADGSVLAASSVQTGEYSFTSSVYLWDGAQWNVLGGTVFNGTIACMRAEADGSVLVGGSFIAEGNPFYGLALWNGSAWVPVKEHAHGASGVRAMERTSQGDLIVAGSLTAIGDCGVAHIGCIASDGVYAFGSGFTEPLNSVAVLPDGRIVVGSDRAESSGRVVQGPMCWDGAAWTSIGGTTGARGSVTNVWATTGGDVLVQGWFDSIDGVPIHSLARWDGHSWSEAMPDGLYAWYVAPAADGSLIVAAQRYPGDGTYENIVARVDGATTTVLGGPIDGYPYAVGQLPNGDIVVGGYFTSIGGVEASGIARWDGTRWNAMGAGVRGRGENDWFDVRSLLVTTSGKLIVGGNFARAGELATEDIACWDGHDWSAFEFGLGRSFFFDHVYALTNLSPTADGSDRFVAGGNAWWGMYDDSGLTMWDGHAWQWLGSYGAVRGLATLPGTDDVVVAGDPLQINFVRSTDGLSRWTPPASRPVLESVPADTRVCGSMEFTLTVGVAASSGPCTYQWYYEGQALDTTYCPSAATPSLTMTANPYNVRRWFECRVTNACGTTRSREIEVQTRTADLAGPGGRVPGDGVLDNNDFVAFIDLFFARDFLADVGSAGGVWGLDLRWDNNDFIAFIDMFFYACQ